MRTKNKNEKSQERRGRRTCSNNIQNVSRGRRRRFFCALLTTLRYRLCVRFPFFPSPIFCCSLLSLQKRCRRTQYAHFFLCHFVILRSLTLSPFVLSFRSLFRAHFPIIFFRVNLVKCIYLIGRKASAAEQPTITISNEYDRRTKSKREVSASYTAWLSYMLTLAGAALYSSSATRNCRAHTKIAPGIICVFQYYDFIFYSSVFFFFLVGWHFWACFITHFPLHENIETYILRASGCVVAVAGAAEFRTHKNFVGFCEM